MILAMGRCHSMQRVLVTPAVRLRRSMSVLMADHRLDRLAVIGLILVAWGQVIKIVPHAVAREDLRRDHPRADVAASIPKDKAVKAAFLRRPVFARRDEDGPARRPGRSSENERMHPSAIQYRGIWHLPRTFFDYLTSHRRAGEEHGNQRTRENIGTHKRYF